MSRTKRAWRKYSSANTEQQRSGGSNGDTVLLGLRRSEPANTIRNKGSKSTQRAGSADRSRGELPLLVGAPQGLEGRGARSAEQETSREQHRKEASVSHGRHERTQRHQSKKRKAEEEPSNARAIQRAKMDKSSGSGLFLDEAHIRKHLQIPVKEQYPHAPDALFGSSVALALHNIQNNMLNLRQDFAVFPQRRAGNPAFTCTVTAQIPGSGNVNAVGNGYNKRDAAKAAYVHLVAKFHESGVLKDLFPPPELRLDQQTIREERDAKTDIYNYAARFGLIPEFTQRKVARSGRRGQMGVEVTIEIKEQCIKTVGRGTDLLSAEVAAGIRFKAAAEQYHAEHGDESIVIKDSAALHTGNIKNFLEFYKIKNRGAIFEADVKPAKSFKSGSLYLGQVMLDKTPVGIPVAMPNKKGAEELAYLVAAVTLVQRDPQLLEEFRGALSASGGSGILVPIRPVDMEIDEDAVYLMQETLREVRKLGLPDMREEIAVDKTSQGGNMRERIRLDEKQFALRTKLLKERHDAYVSNPKTTEMRELREALPMTQYRAKVLNQVNNNTYSVIVGATGSGKTTQVPQILLEDAISKGVGAGCDIICTQPRRIAATSVARRVADERNEQLQDTVGYHVRFDVKTSRPGGSINFCTTGILLQQLQHMPDQVFDTVSHIIIDEVHERDILIDFLMILIKKTMTARRKARKSVPKIVLMSATIDSELFAKYFQETLSDGMKVPCPSLSVPGRTFPVKEKYLENILEEIEQQHGPQVMRSMQMDLDTRTYMSIESSFKSTAPSSSASQNEDAEATIDWKRERTVNADGEAVNEKEDAIIPVPLVATIVAHIAKTSKDGAILVFLPGYDEITKVAEVLRTTQPLGVNFNDGSLFKLSTLHSSVPAAEQAEVFKPVPEGCRKVILSTNIAETSVTIPDIQYVVDTGKLREKRYDQVRRITKLQCTWISKSNGKQRAGRAGRVQNGNYYALYSRARFESLRAIGLPEMLRSDLQEVCLDIKAQAFRSPIREFLAQAIEPPSPTAVDSSVLNLVALQALTEEENLTALGRLLASLPVHPSLGKMIVLGVIFRCLDPMIILGAALNERSPFLSPPEKRREAEEKHRRFLEGTNSDHVALINAIRQTRLIGYTRGPGAQRDFTNEHFIHNGAFKTINQTSQQIEEVLTESGLIPFTPLRDRFEGELGHSLLNKNANNINLLKALALAGVHPNLAVCKGQMFRTPGEQSTMIHPASLNYVRRNAHNSGPAIGSLYSYTTMQKSNDGKSILLRDTTASTPLMASLFGGRLKSEGNLITMDGWLPFYVKSQSWSVDRFGVVKTVMEFRKALDRLLTAAYSSIQTGSRSKGAHDNDHTYLADNATREAFSAGLVQVLDKDIGTVVPRPPPRMDASRGRTYR